MKSSLIERNNNAYGDAREVCVVSSMKSSLIERNNGLPSTKADGLLIASMESSLDERNNDDGSPVTPVTVVLQ